MTKAKGSRKTSTVAPSVVALAAAFFLVLLVTNAQFVMNVQAQSNKSSLYETYHWPALGLSIGKADCC